MEKLPLLPPPASPHLLLVHGGAGTIERGNLSPEQQARYRAALCIALHAGYDVLHAGGEAMDAVAAAVAIMEDNPLFNAGKGAVFNAGGKNELEASIMLSKPPASHPSISANRRGISVTLLTRARNPSHLVRALYLSPSDAPHAFLSGATAESIGASLGTQLVDPSYFYTEHRWREHRRGLGLPEEPLPHKAKPESVPIDHFPTGTVGAVALDIRGCIATLTSTGGKTNKLVGRVGDTPCTGSGYWADEWTTQGGIQRFLAKIMTLGRREPSAIGVSGTGDGDYFIRLATAADVAHRVKYLHQPLNSAAQHAIEDLGKNGGVGGLIALDNLGNVAMPLNSTGMYRGIIREDGVPKTAIFADDVLE